MVEIAVVLPILIVATAMLASTLTGTSQQRAILRENSVAACAAQSLIETVRNAPFEQIFALYNEDPFDDPNGPGTAPGASFAVPGLQALPEAEGMIGEVVLPAFNAGGAIDTDWQLREDVDEPGLGMPRDLTGDWVVDDQDHEADATMIPVGVTLRWSGRYGPREFRMHTLLIDWRP